MEAGTGFTSTPDELVTLKVGPNAKSFVVHKQFACDASPVLKAAFTGEFEEGLTQTYALEETTKEVGRLLACWLYTRKVDSKQIEDPSLKEEEDIILVELWVLADELLISDLQNDVIRQLYDNANSDGQGRPIATNCLKYAYQATAKDSKLRHFLVDLVASLMWSDSFSSCAEDFPRQFLLEYAFRVSSTVCAEGLECELGMEKRLGRYRVSRN
ncbi:hypothetical protein LSUE1_G005520 [Lachnellula suecica]|uniref:BTB domain-containing protein n=1 Tax=Lachnellula suecica TaxID=602035 RepID=A0A8T9C4M9_9HELO|nr:hypothetical protein LSUE1_G005520 [Lachnellula suecica]